ncbi:hypothetical protein C8R43DRAFT_940572 [Mycena crocata]|nr:hypothetical protein C8R43DRAFT_940572 [Mycena crocata]
MLAVSRPVSIPMLMLVAARVKEWSSLVRLGHLPTPGYRTVVPPSRPREGMQESDLNILLTAFVGVVNINFEHPIGKRHHGYLGSLPLRRLHFAACDFIEMTTIDPLQYSCFAHITHLQLFDHYLELYREDITDPDETGAYTRLAALPRLTHLSIVFSHSVPPFCAHLLDMCKGLHALVLLHALDNDSDVVYDITDARFVTMSLGDYAADWQRGILLGDDYWARADAFIAKRISGELPRTVFYLRDSVAGSAYEST